MKHLTWLWIPTLGIGVYTAFVATCMWNWFAVRPLRLPEISFLEMVGLVWLIQILISKPGHDQDESRWNIVFEVIDLCVPDEKRDLLAEVLEEQKNRIWINLVSMSFGQIVSNTTTLILGYGLHILIT